MTTNITAPTIMKETRRWVCRTGKKPCDTYGRMRVPYGDEYYTWEDPRMWTSFPQAVAAYERSRAKKGNLSGIGFIIAYDSSRRRDQQIVGLDLDCCRDPFTGWTSPWTLSTLQKLDSPTGVSISECGFRAFAIGRLPDGLGSISGHGVDDLTPEAKAHILSVKPDSKAFNGFEAYAGSPRHLSVTGQWLA